MRLAASLFLIGLFLAAFLLFDLTPAEYEIFELPVVPGYTECSPNWITNGGDIWGWCSNTNEDGGEVNAPDRLVRWNADLEPTIIPFEGRLFSVNDRNQAAGVVYEGTAYTACVLDDRSIRPIKPLDLERSIGCAINNNGLLVVHGLTVSATGATSEIVVGWDVNRHVEIFRFSIESNRHTLRLNDKDTVGGILQTGDGSGVPFLYTRGQGVHFLEHLHVEPYSFWFNHSETLVVEGDEGPMVVDAGKAALIGSLNSECLPPSICVINDRNQVVGSSETNASIRLFRIGFFGQDDWWARVVKWYYSGDPRVMEPRAILWEKGKTRDLNDLIRRDSGWFLTEAYDINDNGEIVGDGFIPNGERRGFLLRPVNHSED